jgi:hypothetical protein
LKLMLKNSGDMNTKRKAYWWFALVAVALLVAVRPSHAAAPTGPLRLELSPHGPDLHVTLENISTTSVVVNQRFALGSEYDPVELNFEIHDSQGRTRLFAPHINMNRTEERDWIWLRPNQFAGRSISLAELAGNFGLRIGDYTVKATYIWRDHQASDKLIARVESNTVKIRSSIDGMKEFCNGDLAPLARKNLPDLYKFCR